MYIDAENTFFTEKTAATSITSDVIDLGSAGPFVHPLYVDIKLTTKTTSGKMDKFKIQSAAAANFSSPVDEMEVTVPASIDQTAKPQTLAQFHSPIKPGNRYVRLVGSASSVSGGKIDAYFSNGIKVDL